MKSPSSDDICDIMTCIKNFIPEIKRNKNRCLCNPEAGNMIELLMYVVQKCLVLRLGKLLIVMISDGWNHREIYELAAGYQTPDARHQIPDTRFNIICRNCLESNHLAKSALRKFGTTESLIIN